jgi:hypothetical protein
MNLKQFVMDRKVQCSPEMVRKMLNKSVNTLLGAVYVSYQVQFQGAAQHSREAVFFL